MNRFRRTWSGLAAASIFLVCSPAQAAAAVNVGIVSYSDQSDGTMLLVGIASDPSVKAAAISIQAMPSSRYDADWTPLTVFFSSKGDWNKFMTLWAMAIRTRPGSDSIDVGDYTDQETKVMLRLTKDPDGSIGFSAYNGHHPFLLNVESSQFKFFGSYLKKVSAYFAKK